MYQVPPRLQRPPPPFASCSPESSEIVRFLFQREDSQLIYPLPSPHPPGLTTRFSFVDSKIQIHPIYRISCYYCRCYCCCYQPDLSAVTQQPSRLPVLSRRDKSSLPSHAHTHSHTRIGSARYHRALPAIQVPEVVASPPSRRSRCGRVCPSSSVLRVSLFLSSVPPAVFAAPRATANREKERERENQRKTRRKKKKTGCFDR